MSTGLIAKATVHINAPAAKVWDALTNPYLIKQYFFGTEAISDWKTGSSLIFRGEWEGKSYVDKGTILASEPNKLFRYNYLSSMSNLEDKPENYANITYELNEDGGKTTLNVTQDNIATEEARTHSEENWAYILNSMKELIEK
jgi:uncharacterized protein YndB with AHSA1/START domain